MSKALELAHWIRGNVHPGVGAMTHLKLQKLSFYCYGATLAFDLTEELGHIDFEAWEHGPVCREIWREYKKFGGKQIPASVEPARDFNPKVSRVLGDVLAIYGVLDAWSLRQETHLEEPWIRTWRASPGCSIDQGRLGSHFREKFRGEVRAPEYLLHSSSFALDGIPVHGYASLHELADAVRSASNAC